MARTLKINGVDVLAFVVNGTISIGTTAHAQTGVMSFSLTGVPGDFVATEELEVILDNSGTKEYAGKIRHVIESTYQRGSHIILDIDCQDYSTLPDDNIVDYGRRDVVESDAARLAWLFTTWGTKGVTVNSGDTFTQTLTASMPTQDFTGKTLSEAINMVLTLSAGQWYVDYDKKLHTFLTESATAPFGLSDVPDNATTYGYNTLKMPADTTALRNAVWYIPGTTLYDSHVFNDDPYNYWSLRETSGTVADDDGVDNQDATCKNAGVGVLTGAAGLVPGALPNYGIPPTSIVAVSGYNLPADTSAWSMECWFEPTGVVGDFFWHEFMSMDWSGGDSVGPSWSGGIPHLGFHLGGILDVDTGYVLTSGVKHHIVVTWATGGPYLIYSDGVLVYTWANATNPWTRNGGVSTISLNFFPTTSVFSQPAIYTKRLSAARVLDHYKAGIATLAAGVAGPTWYIDAASIAAYGRREASITDSTILVQADLDVLGAAYILANKDPIGDSSLICYQPGLMAGQIMQLTNENYELDAATYRIQSITTTYRTQNAPEFSVQFGSVKKSLAMGLKGISAAISTLGTLVQQPDDDSAYAPLAGAIFSGDLEAQEKLIVDEELIDSGGNAGTDGQVLTKDSGTHLPLWATLPTDTDAYIPLSTVTTNQDMIIGSGAGAVARLGIGADENVLTVEGGVVVWAAPDAGLSNPMTTTGDIIYSSDNAGTPQRLAIGSGTQVLGIAAGIPSWVAAGGGGGGVAAKTGKLNRHAALTLTSGALTKFPFDTAETGFDNTNMSTVNSRYTCDVAGDYWAHGCAVFLTAPSGEFRIYKNGSLYAIEAFLGVQYMWSISGLIHCAINDYIELYYYSGSADTVDHTNYTDSSTSFSVHRVA